MRAELWVTGDAPAAVAELHGGFEEMFLARLPGLAPRVLRIDRGEPPPPPGPGGPIVISGSACSMTEPPSWAPAAAETLRDALARGRPILGVCFGHQLLAAALGGEVLRNPAGYRIGSAQLALRPEAAADRLLGEIPSGSAVQKIHEDHVARLPEGAVHLAAAEGSPHEAFRVGARAWGVQFHPEISAPAMLDYLDARAPRIAAEAERRGVEPSALLAETRAAWRAEDVGAAVLAAFERIAREDGAA